MKRGMDSINTDAQITPVIREYRELFLENKGIQEEVRQVRIRFKKRLKEIKDRLAQLKVIILDYMKENNHPGVRFQDVVLLRTDGGNRKKKETDEIKAVFQRHQVSTSEPLYQEILNTIQPPKPSSHTERLTLKLYAKDY